jgi:hypothetical protein
MNITKAFRVAAAGVVDVVTFPARVFSFKAKRAFIKKHENPRSFIAGELQIPASFAALTWSIGVPFCSSLAIIALGSYIIEGLTGTMDFTQYCKKEFEYFPLLRRTTRIKKTKVQEPKP